VLESTCLERVKDPCPLPTAEGEKRRKMGEKGKLIHAPMSDVGGVMFDKVSVSFSTDQQRLSCSG
jgi:ribosome biogenesis protein BMS1